jgi:hypothetical protein
MPKPETDIEYHVSLRSPIFLKLGDRIVGIRSFDAIAEPLPGDTVVFRTDRIWPSGGTGALRDGVSVKTSLTVPVSNIAGMVPQPFVER